MRNLGIMGKMGSGKGLAARYLSKKYHYSVINMGNFARALARRERLKPTRENLEKLQKKYSKHGDYIMEKVLEKTSGMKGQVILDGIRKPMQAKIAKRKLDAVLIEIYAPPKTRFDRMKIRKRKSGFSKTLEEFKEIEKKEEKTFSMNKALKLADYRINNDDGKERLYKDLSAVMKRING